MAKIEEFKGFVKENPRLLKYVKEGNMTWQKFYEMYDLYGRENEIWTPYLKPEEAMNTSKSSTSTITSFTLADTINFLKNMDLDSIQNGINSIQRVVGLVSDMTTKSSENVQSKAEYKPRPLYKHFED